MSRMSAMASEAVMMVSARASPSDFGLTYVKSGQ